MNDVSSELSSNPGRILKAAREELNYSIDRVADELHLRNSVVEAMEQENYDTFSSDVFLKGYFRSYCRLVNLHEERMVEFLEEQLKTRQQEIDTVALNARKQKQLRARKKITTVLILGLAIAGLALYIFGSMFGIGIVEKPDQTKMPHTTAPAEKSGSERPVAGIEKDESGDVLVDKVPASGLTLSNRVDLPENNAAATLRKAQNKLSSQQADVQIEEEALVPSQQTSVSTVSSTLFEARFSGDCWFKLVDGNNKTVFASLKRANDVISYAGQVPFRVVLGNASQVSVSFGGKVVDLAPFTARNGRAALTLGEQR